MAEQWSIAEIESRLIGSVSELTQAETSLRDARDAETDAEIAYQRAHRAALLSPDCPAVSRQGVTVAERDAWVEDSCDAVWAAHKLAKTRVKAAEDHSRRVRDVVSTVQTVASLAKTTFGAAGSTEF